MMSGNSKTHSAQRGKENGELHVDLRACWTVVRSNWHILTAFGLAAMCFCGVYTFFFQRPLYRASVTLKIDTSSRLGAMNPLAEITGGGGGEGLQSKLQTQLDFFHSPDFAELVTSKLAERPQVLKAALEVNSGIRVKGKEWDALREGQFASSERRFELGRSLVASLNMNMDPSWSSLILYAESTEPKIAYEMVNVASKTLLDENYRKVLAKITKSRLFLSAQTTDLRQQLKKLETELVIFQDRHRIFSPNDAQTAIYDNYVRNREKMSEIRRQIATNQTLQGKLKEDLKDLRQKMTDPNTDMSGVYVSQLRHRKDVLQYQKTLAVSDGSKFGSQEIKGIETELESVSKAYRRVLESKERHPLAGANPYDDYQALEKSLSDLRTSHDRLNSELEVLSRDVAGQESRVSDLPTNLQNLSVLRRNIDMTSQLYLASKKKLQETEFLEAETTNDLYMLVRPRVPQMPAGMGISRMYIYAFFIGSFLGLLFIMLKDILIHTVRGRRDFLDFGVEFLTGIVSLSLKPQNAMSAGRGLLASIREEFAGFVTASPPVLVLESLPESGCADNFRTLRLKLLSMLSYDADMHGKTIMVSGPVKGCGKSFVAANLASALAKAEMNTLLVDLDLRKPALSKFFPQIISAGGMETFEEKEHNIDKLIVNASKHLDVLLAAHGATHPPDLLESKEFRIAMAQLTKKYDFIIIDTPPILTSIDCSLISSLADAVVLVASYNETFAEDVKLAAESIRRSGEKEIFGVINFLDSDVSHRVG